MKRKACVVFALTLFCLWASASTRLYLRRAVGELPIEGTASTATYEAYFMVPVNFGDQAPIHLEVSSPELIDYRFLDLGDGNFMVAAKMKRAASTIIHWEAYVLVKQNDYDDYPDSVPIPVAGELPEEVKKWLSPSDCVQSDDPYISGRAAEARGDTGDLVVLAQNIADVCGSISWDFPHEPVSFDAYYALQWGSSCTGHAHAGAALFRANGVPARTLMVMPSWYDGWFDMHWIIDYWVPGYGWVRMETSGGMDRYPPQDEIVVLACRPEDEFPLFFPQGIEGYWHTSDPSLGVGNPSWGGAHAAYKVATLTADDYEAREALDITKAVFASCVETWGIPMDASQKARWDEAVERQTAALEKIREGDLAGYISEMEGASSAYSQVELARESEIFSDDFEGTDRGWTHGGSADTWREETPSGKPASAHSGSKCWGTGFEGSYRNDSDCWLLSPPFDLSDKVSACLDFWLYNWVQDSGQTFINDPLFMEITTDGMTFLPLCSAMGGVNEAKDIPPVGGWSHMALDLTKYAGKSAVKVRFHFRSDSKTTAIGSFIDDFRVYGREGTPPPILPLIVEVRKKADPFRLVVMGGDFKEGCVVLVNGEEVPDTIFKNAGQVLAGKGKALKSLCPKGVEVKITVRNPDGAVSGEFLFAR